MIVRLAGVIVKVVLALALTQSTLPGKSATPVYVPAWVGGVEDGILLGVLPT
jgi:hypothetical protein